MRSHILTKMQLLTYILIGRTPPLIQITSPYVESRGWNLYRQAEKLPMAWTYARNTIRILIRKKILRVLLYSLERGPLACDTPRTGQMGSWQR